ncbi:hypothetical protein HDV00_012597 [Rhizophlyctis rosea]|nr:hypothetical protein HDV00_012597 [Rhizophlyctis rosea]
MTLLLSIPLGIMNLDDNIMIQIVAFCLAMIIGLEWIGASIVNGLVPSRVPAFGQPSGFAQAIGPVLLNLAFTTVVPSWINIKKKSVNAQGVVYTSTAVATAFYLLMGIFTALGFEIDAVSQNLIPALLSSNTVNKVFAYAFNLVMLLPAIPVCFIVTKINLVQNKVTGRHLATFLAQVLPWILVIPLQTGSTMKQFMTWTSLLFVSTANFVIPLVIYLKCLKFRRAYNSDRILTPRQRELLKAIHWSSSTIQDYINGNGKKGLRGGKTRRKKKRKTVQRPPVELLEDNAEDNKAVPPVPAIPAEVTVTSAPAIVLSTSDGEDGGALGVPSGEEWRERKNSGSSLKVPGSEGTGERERAPSGSSWRSGASKVSSSGAGSGVSARKTVQIAVPEAHSDEDEEEVGDTDSEEGGGGLEGVGEGDGLRRPATVEKRPSWTDVLGFGALGTLGRRETLRAVVEGEFGEGRKLSVRSSESEEGGGSGDTEPESGVEEEEPSYLKEDVPDPDMEQVMARRMTAVAGDLERAATFWRRGSVGSGSTGERGRGRSRSKSPSGSVGKEGGKEGGVSPEGPPSIRLEDMGGSNETIVDTRPSHPDRRESNISFSSLPLPKPSTSRTPSPHSPLSSPPSSRSPSPSSHKSKEELETYPTDQSQDLSLRRAQTLPVNPHFVSVYTFRSIPTWFPVRGRTVAVGLLCVTCVISVANIVITLVMPA